MKNVFQIICYIFFAIPVFSQNKKAQEIQGSAWFVGLNGGMNNSLGDQDPHTSSYNEIKRNRNGMQISISAIYRCKSLFGFQSNICFDALGFEKYALVSNNAEWRFIRDFKFVNIEFAGSMHFKMKKISPFISLGIKSGYVYSAKAKTFLNDSLVGSGTFAVHGIPIFSMMMIGANYQLNGATSLALNLGFYMQLKPFLGDRVIIPPPTNYTYAMNYYSYTIGVIRKIN